jgi:hypothetical protein
MKYEVRHNKARERRGLKSYAVFEIMDEGFSRGVSDHWTREDAEAAKHQYETTDSPSFARQMANVIERRRAAKGDQS